jgi:Haemolysin-III related
VLIVRASLDGDPWKVVSASIYGVTLVLLYSFSALYHSLRGQAKNMLRRLDHLSIYLAYRRQLHPVLPADAARLLGLVAAGGGMGAGGAWQPAGVEAVALAGPRLQPGAVEHGDVSTVVPDRVILLCKLAAASVTPARRMPSMLAISSWVITSSLEGKRSRLSNSQRQSC